MSRKMLPVLSLVIAIAMLVAIVGPVFAHQAPSLANANDLNIGIFRIAKTYHLGDVINYEITVYVPLTDPNPSSLPCLQTNMSTYFTDPHDVTGVPNPIGPQTHTLDFPAIPQLLPGESVVFTNGLTTSTIYDPQGGDPTRALLLAGTDPMPASPTYVTSTTIFPGGTLIPGSSYPKLDYTITSADLLTNPNLIAFCHTENTAGAHDNPDNNDNGAKETTISTFTSSPDTLVTISSTPGPVHTGDSVTLTVHEQNTGNVGLTSPSVALLKNGIPFATLTKLSSSYVSGDTDNDTVLDGSNTTAENWTWSLNSGPLTVSPTTFQADGHGFDNSAPAVDITFDNGFTNERASTEVTVISPSTIVTIDSAVGTVVTGHGTTLTVKEQNNGDVALTSPSVVVTDGGTTTLTHASATFKLSSDTTANSILDVGETWEWDLVPTGNLTADTTFTANGHGTDTLGRDISFANGYETEQAQITVNVISPDTLVSINAAVPTVHINEGTTLTVTEGNPSSVILSNPNVVLTGGLSTTLTKLVFPVGASFSGDTIVNGKLDPGETWQWDNIPTGNLSGLTSFTATGHGTDPLGNDVTFDNGYQGERASAEVNVISPNTLVTITSAVATVHTGDGTTLTVKEQNTGDTALTSPSVVVTNGGTLTLLRGSATFKASTDPATPGTLGVLDVGETWEWDLVPTGPLTANTTFTANGHGTDTLGRDISFADNYTGERAQVTVDVISPNTIVSITAAASSVLTGHGTTLNVFESNPSGTGAVPLSSPSVVVTDGGTTTLDRASIYFKASTDPLTPGTQGTLDVGETWEWDLVPTGPLTSNTTFTANGHGTDTLGRDISFANGYESEQTSVTVDVIHPNTAVDITAAVGTVHINTGTTLTVTENNPGDVPLASPRVEITGGLTLTLNRASATFKASTDPATPGTLGVLDVGETWEWDLVPTGPLTTSVTFTATGHGTEPLGSDVTFDTGYQGEQDSVTVNVINPNTSVTVVPAAATVHINTGTTLTVTESNPFATNAVPLTLPRVELTGGVTLTLNRASATFKASTDPATPGTLGVLDVGETWEWDLVPTGPLGNATTFTATGHGTDTLGTDITFDAYPDEQASTTVTVIAPNTIVTVAPAAATVLTGHGTTLTVTESNPTAVNAVPLTLPRVELTGGITLTLNRASATFKASTDPATPGTLGVLDVGETWEWDLVPTGNLTSNTSFTATGHGTDPLGTDITVPSYPDEQASTDVTVIHPNTAVDITAAVGTVHINTGTTLTVTENNPGDVPLASPRVEITGGLTLTLNRASATFKASTDPATPGTLGVLDVGETWEWDLVPTGPLTTSVTFTATGHGTEPLGSDVTFDTGYQGEQDSVTVNVINPNTSVTVVPAAATVHINTGTTLTVTESNPFATNAVPLTLPRVELTGGVTLTLNRASATFKASTDPATPGTLGVLDVGETWEWDLVPTGLLGNATTFTATGHGTDTLGTDITFDAYPDEQASTTVTVIAPNTIVTVAPAAATVLTGHGTTLTVTESNPTAVNAVPLTLPRVELTGGITLTLNRASATFKASTDPATPGTLGVLDVGETWEWDLVPTGNLTSNTSFTATGHGTDPLGTDITVPSYPDEQASTDVTVIHPNTGITIHASSSVVNVGGSTDLTISETNSGDSDLSNAFVVMSGGLSVTLNNISSGFSSSGNGDSTLAVGETWTWTGVSTGPLAGTTAFTATGHGTDAVGNDVTFANGYANEQASVTVTVIHPHTTAHMTLSQDVIPGGGNVTLTISDTNDGDVALLNNHMHLNIDPLSSSFPPPLGTGGMPNFYFLDNIAPEIGTFMGESMTTNGILDIGETWSWTIIVHVTLDTTFTAIGDAQDPTGASVTYPGVPSELATNKVKVPLIVPAVGDFGILILIAGLAVAMLYLVRRKGKRQISAR